MRPLELGLENFRSYFGGETVFSFRDRSLVGIVGPIGSGKSSVLDAIAFALYGKTPTIGAATRSLIHQRAANAMVRLRFEVDGQIWEAVRRLREKGQGVHALYRLDEDAPDQDPVERFTLEGEVNAKIVELLGLEFEAFGRSVLLAQNRFAEFLRARPVERDKVLKGVFGHDLLDTMREAARSRAAALHPELGELNVRIEQFDRISERLENRRERRRFVEERLEALQHAEEPIAAINAAIADSVQRRTAADQRLAEMHELAGRLPEPAATDRLFAEAEGAAEKRAELAASLEAAQAELGAAERSLADAQAAGSAEAIDRATALWATLSPLERAVSEAGRRLARADARIEKLAGDRQAAEARVAGADQALVAAEADLAEQSTALLAAEDSVLEIRHAEMAMSLRSDLHPGDECPVCAREVHEVPELEPSADLEAALAVRKKAEAARSRADQNRLAATAEAHGAREVLASLEAEAARIEAEHVAAADAVRNAEQERDTATQALTELLGGPDFEKRLQALRDDAASRQDAVAKARKGVERARAGHDAAIRDEQETRKRLSALHVDLAGLVAKLDVPIEIDDDTPATLRGAVAQLREAWAAVSEELTDSRTQAAATEESARRELLSFHDRLDIQDDFRAVLAGTRTEADMITKEIAESEEELAGSAALIGQRDEMAAAQARFDQIATDLTDSKFVRYLLDDEKTRLAALGSEHFQRLSSGRYRFSEDGKFEIVDLTAAEAVRRADSLSGGETFLASLALALALAEMVARTGGRLDAFFIDEGFGSLDPEHLDLAMEGIEVLASDGADRLVVVVSHVPELRHRIEDLIELDRSPTTGDTRVVRA